MEDSKLELHLKELEETLLLKRKEDFKSLLADDFKEFGASGRVFNKEDQLATFSGDEHKRKWQYTLSKFQMTRLSESVAHVTFLVFNEDLGKHSWRSSIWRMYDGEWQMFFHQGTLTEE